MKRFIFGLLFALLLALGMFAAACGDDDGDGAPLRTKSTRWQASRSWARSGRAESSGRDPSRNCVAERRACLVILEGQPSPSGLLAGGP